MKASEFCSELRAGLPKTGYPVVSVPSFPLTDGLWIIAQIVPEKAGDPVKGAKVEGMLSTSVIGKSTQIQLILVPKEDYSKADVDRAIAIVSEAEQFK